MVMGQKVGVMGPVADSPKPRPAALASETVQKKSEKELLTMIRDRSRTLDAHLEGGVIVAVYTECLGQSGRVRR